MSLIPLCPSLLDVKSCRGPSNIHKKLHGGSVVSIGVWVGVSLYRGYILGVGSGNDKRGRGWGELGLGSGWADRREVVCCQAGLKLSDFSQMEATHCQYKLAPHARSQPFNFALPGSPVNPNTLGHNALTCHGHAKCPSPSPSTSAPKPPGIDGSGPSISILTSAPTSAMTYAICLPRFARSSASEANQLIHLFDFHPLHHPTTSHPHSPPLLHSPASITTPALSSGEISTSTIEYSESISLRRGSP